MTRRKKYVLSAIAILIGITFCVITGTRLYASKLTPPQEYTWEEVHGMTASTLEEIIDLIPTQGQTVIEYEPEGIPMRCDREQFRWYGSAAITLDPSADHNQILQDVAEHFKGSRFKIKKSSDTFGVRSISLSSKYSTEAYQFGWNGKIGTMKLVGYSACAPHTP